MSVCIILIMQWPRYTPFRKKMSYEEWRQINTNKYGTRSIRK